MTNKIKIYEETIFRIIGNIIKGYIFKLITVKSSGLFLKGGDSISIAPQIFGIHEEPLTDLIKYYVNKEYNDFLLDIGANIGLTSCQNGIDFKEVHMFEPNPLCCNILEVNAKLSLDSEKFMIHRYGLGDTEKKCRLTVPKHNWGGAFVRDENNSYSDNILALKDGFKEIDNKNYFEVEVVIKEAKQELKKIFELLSHKDFNRGVIKIDVEGYEESVLIGIARSIPSNIRAVIVFESWDERFNLKKVVNSFEGRCIAKRMKRSVPWVKKSTKIIKILCLLTRPIIKYKITEATEGDMLGDIILEIN
jgi:FkbM family methyltransferase